MTLTDLKAEFLRVFGDGEEPLTYFAPGRVNLIGEHTDYNGGHVFPCALTMGTYALVRVRNDETLRFCSVNFPESGVIQSTLSDRTFHKEMSWTNYPRGVMKVMSELGYLISCGLDILYCGTIPNSSGLSSSASIEVLTGYLLKDIFGLTCDNREIALIGQRAENSFIGVNCGIMDQFAIAMGKKGQAIFLDTGTLTYEYAPIALNDARIVIMNTNKKRGLGDSKYNERRSECEQALARIRKCVNVAALGELSEEQFADVRNVIGDETLIRRARHAVFENRRTVRAFAALKAGNLKRFGELMNESHISLRDDYEVTGIELDTLVTEAWKQEGVIGARMTGAGFGGCAVSIVKNDSTESFIKNVSEAYQRIIGYDASFYVAEIGDGPSKLQRWSDTI